MAWAVTVWHGAASGVAVVAYTACTGCALLGCAATTVPIGTGASAVTAAYAVACTGCTPVTVAYDVASTGCTPVTVAYDVACTGCALVAAAGYVATHPPPDVDAPPLGMATTGTGVMVGTPVPRGGLLGWN